jgi:SAM-dependent methyltransferase
MTTPNPNPTPRAPHEYIPGYKPTHIAIHSWRTAENSAAHLLPTLRHLATTNPHLQLLDCGCGPGTITASLAKYMPPTGHITATDISPDVLAMARATARAAGVAPHALSHVPADVHALPFPDAHFDVVHAQQLLCHLARPRDALREMWRVVRPGGGVLALKECDLGSWTVWPALTGCVETGTATVRAMEVGGGSGDLGRRLLGLCLDGLEGVRREDVVLSMGTWCYSTREVSGFFSSSSSG